MPSIMSAPIIKYNNTTSHTTASHDDDDEYLLDVTIQQQSYDGSDMDQYRVFEDIYTVHCFKRNMPAIFRNAHLLRGGPPYDGGEVNGGARKRDSTCKGTSLPFFDLPHLQRTLHLDQCSATFGPTHPVPVTITTTPTIPPSISTEDTTTNSTLMTTTTPSSMVSPSSEVVSMPIGAFIETTTTSTTNNNNTITTTSDIMYLKDWHYLLEYEASTHHNNNHPTTTTPPHLHHQPSHNALYILPPPMRMDWLNTYMLSCDITTNTTSRNQCCWAHRAREHATTNPSSQPCPDLFGRRSDGGDGSPRSDFRFVYIGRPGTCTPRHTDVFGSYSWSFNVQGKKRWSFFRPTNQTNSVEDGGGSDDDVDIEYIVEQGPGDLIFVPSGLEHVVVNEEPSSSHPTPTTPIISVNQNWFNRYNILKVVGLLCREAVEFHNMMDEECRGAFRGDVCDMNTTGITNAHITTDELNNDPPSTVNTYHLDGDGCCCCCVDWSPGDYWRTNGWVVQVERVLEASGSWNLSSMYCLLHATVVTMGPSHTPNNMDDGTSPASTSSPPSSFSEEDRKAALEALDMLRQTYIKLTSSE